MLTYDDVKTILFPTHQHKNNFLAALQIVAKDASQFIDVFRSFSETPAEQKNDFLSSLDITPSDFSGFDDAFEQAIITLSDRNLQLVFAPFLRETTLEFLRSDHTNATAKQIRSFGQAVYIGDVDNLTWDDFLQLQTQPRQHATYLEVYALSALFKFNLLITTRTIYYDPSGVAKETRINETQYENYGSEFPTLRFICEGSDDNEECVVKYTHWYIYEDGYYRTLADGNCLYNGMAQWLRILLQAKQPAEIAVLYAAQSALLEKPVSLPGEITSKLLVATEMTGHALALQLVSNDESIAAIRKQLESTDASRSTSNDLLAEVSSACESLQSLCAKTPQYSSDVFNQLLDNLSTSQQLLSQSYEPNRADVLTLFGVTQCILNALHAPNSSDKNSNSTKERYNQNLDSLTKLTGELLDSKSQDFINIGHAINAMNFTKVALDPVQPGRARKNRSQTKGFQALCRLMCTHYLLPSLRILAYTLMIASVLSLICFIAIALLPKAALLLGPYLVACGLNKALIALTTFAGFNAPTSASSLGIAGSVTSLAEFGLGYSLFKAYNHCDTTSTPRAPRPHRLVGCI